MENKKQIAIVDYGAGNLFSVENALDFLQIPWIVTAAPQAIRDADGVILPGVGAFPDAMERLRSTGLEDTLREEAVKKPFLGICLGMQMLFETGFEFQQTRGLGLIPGTVEHLRTTTLKIPHMGWNSLHIHHACPLTQRLREGDYVYFVHSFCANTDEEYVSLSTQYGQMVPALVNRGTVYGAQFHPEKSGEVGLGILRCFYGLL